MRLHYLNIYIYIYVCITHQLSTIIHYHSFIHCHSSSFIINHYQSLSIIISHYQSSTIFFLLYYSCITYHSFFFLILIFIIYHLLSSILAITSTLWTSNELSTWASRSASSTIGGIPVAVIPRGSFKEVLSNLQSYLDYLISSTSSSVRKSTSSDLVSQRRDERCACEQRRL